jgi:CubicO group peptidase (beta-lactamase class C family)
MARVKLPILLLSVGLAVAPSFAQEATGNVAAIRSYYEAGLRRNGIVGSSLALLHNGKLVFRDNYGLQGKSPDIAVDDNTTYHWASCTKTFTGIAIMQLRDRGMLSLDDPLIKYIPELAAVHDPFGPISNVTIRHVMSHSGGFRDATWPWHDDDKAWQPFEPTHWSQIVAMMPYTEVLFAPGSRFSYSNLGVVFLGEIIERLSGDPYQVYMEKNVLRPLGMSHSYFDRSPYSLLRYRSHSWDLKAGKLSEDPFDFNTGITRSNGGLNAPIPDMLKYLGFLLGDTSKETDYSMVLKRASLVEMWKPFLPVTPDDDFQSRKGAHDEVTTSFFVHADGDLKLVGHAGWQNGFRSHFYLDPATRSAYIVAYNTDALDDHPTDEDLSVGTPVKLKSGSQSTRSFDFELRDYLIDHFFRN